MADQGTWPKDQIKALAEQSGKPLEVLCGQAFLRSRTHSWKAQLGSYFQDGDRVRELDVLAQRQEVLPKTGILCRMRVLVSCRGFPPDAAPLAYSVGRASPLLRKPSLLATYRRPSTHVTGREDREVSILLGMDTAPMLLSALGLDAQREIVALDVIQQDKEKQQQRRGVNATSTVAADQTAAPILKLKNDERIYSAIDSAVKAAFYWASADHQSPPDGYVTLNVPICVFSIPFWDVAIDNGRVSDPEQRSRSHQTSAYPVSIAALGRALDYAHVSTLVVSLSEIDAVVGALDSLFIDFRDAFVSETSDLMQRRVT